MGGLGLQRYGTDYSKSARGSRLTCMSLATALLYEVGEVPRAPTLLVRGLLPPGGLFSQFLLLLAHLTPQRFYQGSRATHDMQRAARERQISSLG